MTDSEARSQALMAALTAGDDDALGDIVTLWQAPVLRFVFRYVQNEADAREIVQETFVRVHAKRGTFRPGASFSGWLFTIAANLCRNRRRWWKRHPTESLGEENAIEHRCSRSTPGQAMVDSERIDAVRRAIDDLPHDLKVTLLLHEYENLTYAEISPVVGCSVKGVEARLARARRRLRTALADYLADGGTKERNPSGASSKMTVADAVVKIRVSESP
jgi:RNA polymerase sigma-70 factor, ECF subfamily